MKRQKLLAACIVFVLLASAAAQQKPRKPKPAISMQQAQAIALKKQPGTILSSELEKEKGRLIYSFDIQMPTAIHEVNVDAMTGRIVEDSVESAAKEAREKKQEGKKERRK